MTNRNPIATLRTRLKLQAPVDVPDPLGGFARDWQDVADIWASVASSAPVPQFVAARQDARVTHRITIRWRPDITAAMRFEGDGGTYVIHGANDSDAYRAFLVCYCEQVVS